jgi:hypothetical protein
MPGNNSDDTSREVKMNVPLKYELIRQAEDNEPS